MRVSFRVALGLMLLTWAIAAGAQAQRGRGAEGDPIVIRGLVVGAESGAPLRRARIATSRDTVPAVFTGEDGRFELLAPPSSLRVTKPGHVSLTVERTEVPRDGSLLTVSLVPGAVITGTVFEATGMPAVSVRVRVRRASDTNGRGGPQYQTETDDRGLFRVGNLPAGRYDVDTGSSGGRGGRGRRGGGAAPAPPSVSAELRAGRETAVSLVLSLPDEAGTPRPQPAVPTRDGGAIRGRIVSAEGTPVDRASVTAIRVIAGNEQNPQNGQNASARTATTDASGAYELTGVPPGEYRVRASRAGFPPVEYGQSMALQDGRIVRVLAKGRVQGIDISLPRGAAVSGGIVDAWGEPIEDLEVEVLQARHIDGRVRLVSAPGVRPRRTDDRGQFRLHGLLPGSYYVMASDRTSTPGRIPSPNGQADSALGRRVDDLLGARNSATVDIFYPGTPRVTDALALTVAPGQDVLGLDMVFAPQPGATVSGTAVGSRGVPVRGRAVLAVSARYGAPLLPLQTAGLDAEGRFEFPNVAPGDYVVQVSGIGSDVIESAQSAVEQAGGRRGGRGGGRDGGGGRNGGGGRGGRGGVAVEILRQVLQTREFGTQFVSVANVRMSDLLVQTSAGSTITGRIELEGDAGAVQVASFGLAVRYSDPDLAPLTGEAPPRTTVNADGTFTMTGLTGPSRFVASQAPAGWWLKSFEVGGIDAARDPAIFGRPEQSAAGVVVTFASGAGRIDGHVTDERQQRVSEFAVIVFSTDQERWFAGSPYVTLASAAQDGSFSVSRLPPGDYYAVAVERVEGGAEGGAWQRPEMLGGLATVAQRIDVRQSQPLTAELKLIRLTM